MDTTSYSGRLAAKPKLGASINNLVVLALALALRSAKECAWEGGERERRNLLSNSFKLDLAKAGFNCVG